MLSSRDDAYALLDSLGAPARLRRHVELVGEAADMLIETCERLDIDVDTAFVRIGVAIHDVGKIVHPGEMTGSGSEHEPEGERLLLDRGVSADIARVCLSHARWADMDCSTEELLIALADKLWKGRRSEPLELAVIDQLTSELGRQRWDLFIELDQRFEEIASGGHDRLLRSDVSAG